MKIWSTFLQMFFHKCSLVFVSVDLLDGCVQLVQREQINQEEPGIKLPVKPGSGRNEHMYGEEVCPGTPPLWTTGQKKKQLTKDL